MTNPLQPLIKTIADGGHLPRPDMEPVSYTHLTLPTKA